MSTKVIIGISGASGAIYLQRLLDLFPTGHEVHLILSSHARQVIEEEIGELTVKDNIQSESDAMGQLQQFGYSRSAPLKIMRNGKPMTLEIKAGKPQPPAQAKAKTPHAGGSGKDEIQQQIDVHQALPGMP